MCLYGEKDWDWNFFGYVCEYYMYNSNIIFFLSQSSLEFDLGF